MSTGNRTARTRHGEAARCWRPSAEETRADRGRGAHREGDRGDGGASGLAASLPGEQVRRWQWDGRGHPAGVQPHGRQERAGMRPSQAVRSATRQERAGIRPSQALRSAGRQELAGMRPSQAVRSAGRQERAGMRPSQAVRSAGRQELAGIRPSQAVRSAARQERAGIRPSQALRSATRQELAGMRPSQAVRSAGRQERAGMRSSQAVRSAGPPSMRPGPYFWTTTNRSANWPAMNAERVWLTPSKVLASAWVIPAMPTT